MKDGWLVQQDFTPHTHVFDRRLVRNAREICCEYHLVSGSHANGDRETHAATHC